MDIINKLPQQKFHQIDDLLTYISIYDDYNRTQAYYGLLENHKWFIQGKVCVELGAGLGIMSEKMAQLGAQKVYAVEVNPYLARMAQKRLEKYPQVEVINMDARDFVPDEEVSILVYDFFGQMLYDEELYILDSLKWKPKIFLPDGAKLLAGTIDIQDFDDPVVNVDFLPALKDVLVSGLFSEEDVPLEFEVMNFSVYSHFVPQAVVDISKYKGNLLYFGIELTHNGESICRAGLCDNWSYVWTYRYADKFSIAFEQGERAPEVIFNWI